MRLHIQLSDGSKEHEDYCYPCWLDKIETPPACRTDAEREAKPPHQGWNWHAPEEHPPYKPDDKCVYCGLPLIASCIAGKQAEGLTMHDGDSVAVDNGMKNITVNEDAPHPDLHKKIMCSRCGEDTNQRWVGGCDPGPLLCSRCEAIDVAETVADLATEQGLPQLVKCPRCGCKLADPGAKYCDGCAEGL